MLEDFERLGSTVVGVSADDEEHIADFVKANSLTYPLVPDPMKDIIRSYGVEDLPGPRAKRVTFLIDPEGTVVRVWDKVDVNVHPQEVLDTVREESMAEVT